LKVAGVEVLNTNRKASFENYI